MISLSKMEDLRNRISSNGLGAIVDPEVVQEKLSVWSSSVYSNLTFDNLRDAFASIGRSIEPENIEKTTLSYFGSVVSYFKENPILISVSSASGIQTHVNLPYFGVVSLDVFLFWSTAVLTRVHMFWKNRKQTPRLKRDGDDDDDDDDGSSTRDSSRPQYPPYSPMRERQDIHKSLYKPQALYKPRDPEVVRMEKNRTHRRRVLEQIGGFRYDAY